MSQSLISFLEGQLSGQVISQLAAFLGEEEVRTATAALAGQQALLVAVTRKATSPEGAGELLSMVSRVTDGTGLGHAASLWPGGTSVGEVAHLGAPVASGLLGVNQTRVADWLASAAGIGRQSSTTLLGLLAPVVLRGIGSYLTSIGGVVNASALGDLFSRQAPSLLANIPAGLAGALDLTGDANLARAVRAAPASTDDARDTGLEFLKWVLPLIVLATLLVYALSRPIAIGDAARSPADAAESSPVMSPPAGIVPASPAPATARTAPAAADVPVSPGRLVDRALPNRASIRVPENGVESRLLAFVADRNQPVDSTTWFSFDRLDFDPATATLRPSSTAQLDAMAAILKAYPTVSLKIGGYTDSVGDQVANLRLSAARAESIRNALVDRGVSARRLDAEGFGERFPVATNATEQGRQRNRRIDVRVTRK